MTLPEFLDALTACAPKYRWSVNASGQIRGCAWGEYDPVTAVAALTLPCFFTVAEAGQAAAFLGVGPQDWYAMVQASDGKGEALLRQALLRTVGLAPGPSPAWDAALAELPRTGEEA